MANIVEVEEAAVDAPKDRKAILAEALDGAHDTVDFEASIEDDSDPEGIEASAEVDKGSETPDKPANSSKPVEKVEGKAGEQPEIILAPAEFDEKAKKEFEGLPPEIKRTVSKRFYDMRRDYTAKTMELAQHRAKYQQLEQVSKAHEGRLARKGVSVEQAISNALAWDHFVEEQGANAALQWLEKHGFDPEELIEARDGGQAYSGRQQQAQIPTEIQRELEESRQFRQMFAQQAQGQMVAQVHSTLDQFRASKPIFRDPSTAEQIESAMTPIVKGLRSANPTASHGELLERAYNYVVNGDERFRNLVNGAEKRRTIEAQRDHSQRAIRAASSVGSTGPGSGSPVSIPKGRRNIIAAALDNRLTL